MIHKKHSTAVLLALSFTPVAWSGDVLLEARGTVVQNSYSSGPFAATQPGDSAVMLVEVFVPGTDITPGQFTAYDIDVATSMFIAGSGSDAFAAGSPVINVQNDFPAADGIRMFGNPLASGGGLAFEFGAPGTLFGSTDVTLEAGVYPAAGSWTSYNWALAGGGGFMEIMPDEFIIHGAAQGTNYCTATPNSTGMAGSLSASGLTSLAANTLTLEATGLPDEPGVFFFGTSQTQVPFGNGFRCVDFPVVRLNPPVVASGGTATSNVDIPTAGIGLGAHDFQFWYRDPAGGGAGFNLTDGLEIVFVP